MVRPEPQPAWLHGSMPRAQTEGEWGIVRASMSSTTMRPAIGGRRILVVGAGIAGLGAARALHDLGYEVEVVEARERLGGRIWTVDRIDYGAHWIHGTEGNPITQLARMLELPTLFVGGDSTYTGGWQHIEFRSRAARAPRPVARAVKRPERGLGGRSGTRGAGGQSPVERGAASPHGLARRALVAR
jgi:choline dehydrogenase-like flavoprotein